ncbi:mitochondrial escape protein 2 [Rhodotorula kratochvilovae]
MPNTPPPLRPSPSPHIAPETATHHPDEARRSAYLWFDQVYPIRFAIWDVRYLVSRMRQEETHERLRATIPAETEFDVKVESVEPRAKDGGAFVRVSFKLPDEVQREAVVEGEEGPVVEQKEREREVTERITAHVEKLTSESLSKNGFKPWFALGRPSRAFLVKGTPWMEDMNRFPSREIRLEYEGSEIPQEELYQIFRPYGKIHDIIPGPKSARIIYTSIRSATSARNCLHAASVTSTLHGPPLPPGAPPRVAVLRILYADAKRTNYVRDFMTSHPRITIPLLVALLGTISYAIFDPIREVSVMAKVEGTFDADQWAIVRWLKKETIGRLAVAFRSAGIEQATATGIEKERAEAKEQLQSWLLDRPDTFIVVTGPQGSGKTALVDEVLADGKNVLTIDCNQLLKNARSDTKLVSELASSVGYWPQFVLASSINNMIDLASMGLIGQKAGFSASLDAQLKAILEVTATALSRIAASTQARSVAALADTATRKKHEAQREAVATQLRTEGIRDGRIDAVAGSGIVAELGGGIEGPAAGAEKEVGADVKVEIVGPTSSALVKDAARTVPLETPSSGDKPADAPSVAVERLPVVVIKGFAAKGEAKQEVLWDVLSEWAAVLVENQVAHVVFTSESATLAKPLAKALPSKPFNVITLTDASPEASLQYVSAKLASFEQTLPTEAFPAVARLGGRQTDLELLVQKIRAGQTVDEAVDDIIQRNASEIRKNFFGDDEEEAKGLKWSRGQAWAMVTGLSEQGELKYGETLLTTFGGDDAPLRALESASLISVHHVNGRPSSIRPGKPVYRAACERLIADAPFRAAMEYRAVDGALKTASGDVESAQRELTELARLFTEKGRWAFGGGSTVPKEVEVRVGELLAKMRGAQAKQESLAAEKARLLTVLKEAE